MINLTYKSIYISKFKAINLNNDPLFLTLSLPYTLTCASLSMAPRPHKVPWMIVWWPLCKKNVSLNVHCIFTVHIHKSGILWFDATLLGPKGQQRILANVS